MPSKLSVVSGTAHLGASIISGTGHVPDKVLRPGEVRGRVWLWSAEANQTVLAQHEKLPQVLQERAGGWRVIDRPGQLPVTTWDASKPLKVQLFLLFDGWSQLPRAAVTDQLAGLRRLGYRAGELDRPPSFQIIGKVPYADGGIVPGLERTPPDWVIETLEIEELLHLPSGRVSRARATVTLLEYLPSNVRVGKQQSLERPRRIYTWRKGDTLSAVAKQQLGDKRRAQWIRDANPAITRRGWANVKPGTRVVIPRRQA